MRPYKLTYQNAYGPKRPYNLMYQNAYCPKRPYKLMYQNAYGPKRPYKLALSWNLKFTGKICPKKKVNPRT